MIPNQWYAVLESRSLPAGKPVALRRMGEDLVLWRGPDGRPVCMEDRCAHRGIALSLGSVRDGCIQCAYHGFRYDPSGRCLSVPCNGADAAVPKILQVRSYPVQEANGYVFMWWGEERQEYPPIPWIDEIPTDPATRITRSENWPFNYARLVENNLDSHHWRYLHGSIMVGVGERIDDFRVTVGENTVRSEGILRRATNAPDSPGWPFLLGFRAPNLNLIKVTPRFLSIVVSTPIDEHTSWVSISSFQQYSRLPIVRQMIDQYCIQFLFAVPQYRQDFPVFHGQRPKRTGLGVNKLVKADQAIAEYLRMRERLIKEATATATQGEGEDAIFDRKRGTWNATVTGGPGAAVTHLPVLSAMDPRERNAHKGRETGIRERLVWLRHLLTYPLLVPSLLVTTVLDALDAARASRARLPPKQLERPHS